MWKSPGRLSDIAILESLEPQTHYDESATYDEFCECTPLIKLQRIVPKRFDPFPVWLRTHYKTWVAGIASYRGGDATFCYETDNEILKGTSGGPIVNSLGELVGVVSFGTNASSNGKSPVQMLDVLVS
jgi:hypothetical protein